MQPIAANLAMDAVNYKMAINPTLLKTIQSFNFSSLSAQRKIVLDELIESLIERKEAQQLLFVCTHNSRRSQMAQVWAQLANSYFNTEWQSFSGGTEVTAFNINAINALQTLGFQITKGDQTENPQFDIQYDTFNNSLKFFSKKYTDHPNPSKNFIAIMNCSDAEANCPLVRGAEAIFALKYDDPKIFDNTTEVQQKYIETARTIGCEIFYIFKNIAALSKQS